ncbi:hypothetical protein [Nesterenkonia alkaliphila]|uniref:Uncharacterized protein n=1 Tax=Nesterenkonia alkaliphila TaxID=1463631 RepID=A0A7K1UGF8_9MICC|nr:hypothetical protein [Nesterenkonia alkaliphila]MVT25181.1 hypothetical protein [Nesterenkonia alkaliphila]GFZ93733.1 hypothetical protein GCM10011359_24090 [Nesterenkonia alkaliphila]
MTASAGVAGALLLIGCSSEEEPTPLSRHLLMQQAVEAEQGPCEGEPLAEDYSGEDVEHRYEESRDTCYVVSAERVIEVSGGTVAMREQEHSTELVLELQVEGAAVEQLAEVTGVLAEQSGAEGMLVTSAGDDVILAAEVNSRITDGTLWLHGLDAEEVFKRLSE